MSSGFSSKLAQVLLFVVRNFAVECRGMGLIGEYNGALTARTVACISGAAGPTVCFEQMRFNGGHGRAIKTATRCRTAKAFVKPLPRNDGSVWRTHVAFWGRRLHACIQAAKFIRIHCLSFPRTGLCGHYTAVQVAAW